MSLAFQSPAFAAIAGICSNCHTMHNSQNGTSMNWNNSATPNDLLLRSDCLGCHARGIAQNIESTTGTPQVLHTDTIDLAAGNFAYITAAKARITADQNTAGHNVIDLGATYYETILTQPPGEFHSGMVSNTELTCAGMNGCHGKRTFGGISGLRSVKGAHHNNIDGKLDNPISDNNVGHHYRFLMGIKGYEDSDWQATNAGNDHNEYFGATSPLNLTGCSNTDCHYAATDVRPSNQTISGFCATCHGNFHSLQGIGGNTSSPFIRHPSDVVLPNSGEYSAYTAYSTEAPIARTTVPDPPSPTVTPGATDVVMCLSCHAVHATPYADILRWDYSDMIAGDSSKSGGCFTCHTQKNQNP